MTNIANKILDYYDFLLRENENQFFKHTGTPAFHLLIKNKINPDKEYKQIPHGKGGCILNLGYQQKTFVFDELYNILIPVLADEKIIEKWKDKKQAENNINSLTERYLNNKNIIIMETILNAQKNDLINILKEKQQEIYLTPINNIFTKKISEIIAKQINNSFLYLIQEGNKPDILSYFIISKHKKTKEDALVDVFDAYNYIDKLVATNQKKYEVQHPYLGEID